jgi:hypothetical protein
MMSQENALGRQQIIQKCQQDLYQVVQAMVTAGTLTPEMFKKVKKPFADTLYVLGVKDADSYLPSDTEVRAMIEQGQAAVKAREPSPEDKKDLSQAELNAARAAQIAAAIEGSDASSQLNYMSMAAGKAQDYGH